MIRIKNLKNKTEQEINAAFPHNQDNKYYVFLIPDAFGGLHILYYRDSAFA